MFPYLITLFSRTSDYWRGHLIDGDAYSETDTKDHEKIALVIKFTIYG